VTTVLNAVLAWAPEAAAAGETTLRWNLPSGTALNVQLTQTTRTQTTVQDAVAAVQIEAGCDLRWTVDGEAADGTIQLTQAFTRLWLKTASPDGQASVYDSASPEEPAADVTALADAVRPLLRVRIGMSLSPRGEILDVRRAAELDRLLRDLPALSGWKSLLTKEGMSRTLHRALGTLPKDPVNAGDQWTVTRQLDTPLGRLVATDTCTYEGPVRDGQRTLDTIRIATDMRLAGDAASPAAAATDRWPRQQLQGVYRFDAAAGFLAESRVSQTLLAEVPYAGGKIQIKTVSTLGTRLTPTDAETDH